MALLNKALDALGATFKRLGGVRDPVPTDEFRDLTQVQRVDEGRVGPHDPPEAALFTEDAPPEATPLGEEYIGRAVAMFQDESPGNPQVTEITDISEEPARPMNADSPVTLQARWVDPERDAKGTVQFYDGSAQPGGFQTYATEWEARGLDTDNPSMREYDNLDPDPPQGEPGGESF